MRISDWSSDVCSSDLLEVLLPVAQHRLQVFNGVRGSSGAAAHCERQDQRRHDRLQLLHHSARTGNGGRPVHRTFALDGGPVRPQLLVSGALPSRGAFLRHCSLGRSAPPGAADCIILPHPSIILLICCIMPIMPPSPIMLVPIICPSAPSDSTA